MDGISVKGGGVVDNRFCFFCMMRVEEGKICPNCGRTADSYTPAVYHLPPGTVLKERYLIGRVLGEGGFGITYIGCDLRLKMRVAIKEYFPTDKANRISRDSLCVSCPTDSATGRYAEGKEQFLQEALILAKMDKQSVIVGVRDFFEENNTAYIVMEYVDGTTFKDLTERRGGRIPPAELMEMIEPLFSALSAMHAQGLIHRDISPENLMLENGEVRLLDFGCARESQNGDSTLTVIMKQGYAPVEQYQNKGQGPWTDVYALSATIYFCLTGIKPPQAVGRLVGDELIPPRKLGINLTQRQEWAILHGMDIRPRRRFQSVQALHDALYEKNCASASTEPTEKEEKQSRASQEQKRRKRKYIYTAILIAAALILTIMLVARISKPKTDRTETEGTVGLVQETPFDDTERLSADPELSEKELRAALADENVSSVVIPAGSHPEIVSGPLEITKPLFIESGAGLTTFQNVTVSGEGLIHVDGSWENYASTRVASGGRLEIGALGCLNGYSLVWLDNAGDLTVEEGGSVQIQGKNWYDSTDCFLILDEEALFQDAIHVTTLEEYDSCRLGTVPIVIDADILLTDYNRCHTVPVLISEGVCVTAPVSDESYCAWDVSGSLLINRGTIQGRVVAGDWNEDGIDSAWKIVNYGTIDGGFWSVTDLGMMVNLGLLRGDGNSTSAFYNFGSFIPRDYQIRNGPVSNSGSFLIGDGSGGWLALAGIPYGFGNSGIIEIGAQGDLRNYSTLQNYGQIITTDETACLWNAGLLCNAAPSSVVDMQPDSYLGGNGVLQYGAGTTIRLSDNPLNDGSAIAFPQEENPPRIVRTEAELRMALMDESCDLVAIEGSSIAVTGDLAVTKGLVVAAPGHLTIIGGNMSVAGDGAFLLGDFDLGGGTLTLLRGANAVGIPVNCGGLTIRDSNSKLVATGSFSLNAGAEVELSNGGSLIALDRMELKKSSLSIGQWGTLRPCAGLYVKGCKVEIARDGELLPTCMGYCFDSETTIINAGFLKEEEIWYDQVRELNCNLRNSGWLELCGGTRIGGNLKNYGTVQFTGSITLAGAMDNQGYLFSVNAAEIEKENGAAFTGNPVEYSDAWSIPKIE